MESDGGRFTPLGYSAANRATPIQAAIVLAAWIGGAHHYSLPDGLMISVTIAVATMCLIMVLNYRTTAIEADIIYVSGAIEWFGQKQIDREDLRDQRSGL